MTYVRPGHDGENCPPIESQEFDTDFNRAINERRREHEARFNDQVEDEDEENRRQYEEVVAEGAMFAERRR